LSEPLSWHRSDSGAWWTSYRTRRGAELRFVFARRDEGGGYHVRILDGRLRGIARRHFENLDDVRAAFERRPTARS